MYHKPSHHKGNYSEYKYSLLYQNSKIRHFQHHFCVTAFRLYLLSICH